MIQTINIMQGDQYAVPVEILTSDGRPARGDTFAEVEIVIGDMRKTLTSGEVTYDADGQVFLFPLTQEETFTMRDLPQKAQLRVKTKSGDVVGRNLGYIIIGVSQSKEVL